MLRVGITGGIGSGKSIVTKIFAVLGIPVYDADLQARRLMNEGILKEQIREYFGEQVYKDDKLDRQQLSAIVFNEPLKLEYLNALVHPATIADADRWMQEQTSPYTIKEAALLFESGAQSHLDFVIGVSAPDSLRLQRVMNRDQRSASAIQAIMDKQLPQEIKMQLCDTVIINDEKHLLLPQVIALHEKFISNSNSIL